LAAIAIVFDFVNPVLPFRRLIDQGRQLWLDESEFGGYAKHRALTEEAPDWMPRASSALSRRRDDDGRETITTA